MKKILITRPQAQAVDFADKLRTAGFEPIDFPVLEIKAIENNIALEQALSKLSCYEWVVFTSVNAVDIVCEQFPIVNWSNVKTAAIGPKTAEALKLRGIHPVFVPAEYVAEAILSGLGDLVGRWVLLPRAEIARRELPEAICNAGGVPHEITIYKTLPAQPGPEALSELRSGVDVITLTSQSAVQNFISVAKQNGLDPLNLPNNPLYACIGPVTEQAAGEAGLHHLIVAEEYTTDGLIAALKQLEAS